MLREHQQELVVEADGLVNGGPDSRAYRQVVRGEPDAHALGLEVRVEALGKLLILSGLANKGGVELFRLLEYRLCVYDQVFRHPTPSQKFLRDFTPRFVQRVNADC